MSYSENELASSATENIKLDTLVWGPWRVPEPIGTVCNLLACLYLAIVFFFAFWPPAVPVTPNTMNYSSLIVGVVAIISGVYYVIWAHKTYTGPVVDIQG